MACAIKHGFDAETEIDKLTWQHVEEIHLAGHFVGADCLIDRHGYHVGDPVWALYASTAAKFKAVNAVNAVNATGAANATNPTGMTGVPPTLIEWDTDIPALTVVLAQAARADAILAISISMAPASRALSPGSSIRRRCPICLNVARMEWLSHRACFARDCAALDLTQLAEVPAARQGELRFTFNPAAAILASDYPLAHICEVHQKNFAGVQVDDFTAGPHFALVYRAGFDGAVAALDAGEYVFLQSLFAGTNLEVVLTRALAQSQ